jgi:hypothetical protein
MDIHNNLQFKQEALILCKHPITNILVFILLAQTTQLQNQLIHKKLKEKMYKHNHTNTTTQTTQA